MIFIAVLMISQVQTNGGQKSFCRETAHVLRHIAKWISLADKDGERGKVAKKIREKSQAVVCDVEIL